MLFIVTNYNKIDLLYSIDLQQVLYEYCTHIIVRSQNMLLLLKGVKEVVCASKNNIKALDTIYINGIIYCIDEKNTICQSIGIKDGIIEVIGTDEEVLKYKSDNTKIINLKRKTVIPGFIDSRCNILLSNIASSEGTIENAYKQLKNELNLTSLNRYFRYKNEDYVHAFFRYQDSIHKCGITTIGLINDNNVRIPIDVYKKAEEKSMLKLRINYINKIFPKKDCSKNIYEQIHELKRNRIIYKTNLFDISHADFSLDGTLEEKKAYLFKPYRNEHKNYNGILLWNSFELQEGVKMANRLDFNVFISARGDNACKAAMDAIEYSESNNESKNYRNSIAHLNLVTKYYIRRMKLLNINAIITPFWFYKNNSMSKKIIDAIGEDRMHRLYPVNSLISENIITASASDYYVVSDPNPIKAIECAVCRNLCSYVNSEYNQDINMSDFKYGLNPSEKITVLEAVKSFTINAAYVLGREKEVGSLEKGKRADFIVLDDNIFETSPLDISTINIIKTYFNGECVYNAEK